MDGVLAAFETQHKRELPGTPLSDRRAVKLQRLIAASAGNRSRCQSRPAELLVEEALRDGHFADLPAIRLVDADLDLDAP